MLDDELLARVLAEPDDVDAKVVYADRLIERGDPRGRFISEQIALRRLDSADPRFAPLLASTDRLLAKHGEAWIGPRVVSEVARTRGCANVPIDRLMNPIFEDGFVRRIAMLEDFNEQWNDLALREPIEGIQIFSGLYYDPGHFERLRPECAPRIRRLSVTPDHPSFLRDILPALIAWGIGGLQDVDLSFTSIDGDDGDRLWPLLRGARVLRLVETEVDDETACDLLASDAVGALETLMLDRCRIGTATLDALRARDLPLKELGLGGYGTQNANLASLAGWRRLSALEHLSFPAHVTASDLRALFPRPSPALRRVRLTGAPLVAESPAAVAGLGDAITQLDLSVTDFGDAGVAELLRAPSLRTLVDLDLSWCNLTDDAIFALVRSPLRSLVRLDLTHNDLSERAIAALAEWPGLANVTRLKLATNRKLTPESLAPLYASPYFAPTEVTLGERTWTNEPELRW